MRMRLPYLFALVMGCGSGSVSTSGDGGGGQGGTGGAMDGGGGQGGSGGKGGTGGGMDAAAGSDGKPGDGGGPSLDGGTSFGDPGDPAMRTKDDVCAVWKAGHVTKATTVYTPGPMECSPGMVSGEAIDDSLRRLNMYRWLLGLGPVVNDVAQNAADQDCAMITSYNGLNHFPAMTAKCYTAAGAAAAAVSNLAAGPDPATSIKSFIHDGGVVDVTHRRHLIEPGLAKIGVGQFKTSTCMGVFDRSAPASVPHPTWWAHPNPGFTPTEMLSTGSWTLQHASKSVRDATVKMVRMSDGKVLEIAVRNVAVSSNLASAIAWEVTETYFTYKAGETYRVTVDGFSGGPITYDVKGVDCP